MFSVSGLLYQLVGNPADGGHFVCTEAESNGPQVVVDVPGTVQVQKQNQLPTRWKKTQGEYRVRKKGSLTEYHHLYNNTYKICSGAIMKLLGSKIYFSVPSA